ncbi:MAG TPA: hypothetical protein VIL46_09030, partial [Gemmataceae bacterium]
MVWVVGIDEAGYGPNLGPLVLSSAAVRVPVETACLWGLLSPAVARADGRANGALVIDDSKKVYALAGGLGRLERGVLSVCRAGGLCGPEPPGVGAFVGALALPGSRADLAGEAWFAADEPLPVHPDGVPGGGEIERLCAACEAAGVVCGPLRSAVIPAPRFNALLDRWGSKAAVLAHGLIELLRAACETLPGDEPVWFHIDKQGGRNHYEAIISAAFPGGWVRPLAEGADRSHYQVLGLGRPVELLFEPRAEERQWTVAL